MSIEADKLKIKNTQVSPATTQTVAGSTSVSSDTKNKPIDFKAQDAKVEEKAKTIDSEIVKFVNSEEFKGLTPEAQVKVLKERFMPGATSEEINKTISLAKQSTQSVTETSNNVDENPNYELSGDESEVEKAAYAYIEKQKLKDVDIDGLRSMLASKSNRTPEEEKLFNQIQEAFNKPDTKSQVQEYENKPLIAAEELLSEDWLKKKPEEKLTVLADKYFSKTDKKYSQLSDIEKMLYLKSNIRNLALSLSDNSRKDLSVGDYSRVAGLLNALNSKGMSVKEYNKLPKSEKQNLYRTYEKETLKELRDLVSADYRASSEWQAMKPEEKLYVYADAFLGKNDPSYENLTPEDRKKYIQAKSTEIISAFVPNWQTLDNDSKEVILTDTMITIDTIIENNLSYDEFQNMPSDKKWMLKAEYKDSHGYKTTAIDNAYQQVLYDYMQKNGSAPTVNDLINEINSNTSIDPSYKKKMLASLELQKQLNDGRNTKVANNFSYEELALAKKTTVEQVINNDFEILKKANPEKQVKKLSRMFCLTNGDEELITKIKTQALDLGYSETMINKALLNSKAHQDAMVKASRNNDSKNYNKAFELSKDIGDVKACKVAAYNVPKALDGEAKDDVAVNIINNHEDYVESLTKGINDFEPDPVTYGHEIASRADVSDAGKSRFTKSIIETAPTPERQLEYGRVFSQIDNAAVTEGLAAASKSVDSSVRNQYDSYVDNAIAKYPPEQQTIMRSARESGQISQETLAKTSVENNGATDSVKSSQRASNNENTSKVANNSGTTTYADKTVVSSQPAVDNASQVATASGKTQTTQNVEAKATYVALEQKKEALLNKIITYEINKAENTKSKKSEAVKSEDKVEVKNNVTTSSKKDEQVKEDKEVKEIKASEVVAEELTLSEDEQETLKAVIEDIFQKNSVSAAYSKLVDTLGETGKEKFLEAFVQRGKEANVRSFAQNYKGNPDTLLKLIGYCQSESLKFDLLKMLPSSSITELISTQKLTTTDFDKLVRENKVESNVILDFINKNKGSMSVQDMKKYMSFLSLADRNALMEILKNTKGSDEWLLAQQENMRTVISDVPSLSQAVDENGFVEEGILDAMPTMEDGLSMGSNKLAMRVQYNKMKKRGPFFFNA